MKARLRRWLGRRTAAEAAVGDEAAASEPSAQALADAPGVLFVCMGNICRSPTAEAVLRAKLQQAGLAGRVRVDSAGTSGHHAGEPPDPRAIRHGQARGYALQALRARAVQPDDFDRFQWVLAMDEANLDWLRQRAPAAAPAQLGLLLSHARRPHGLRAVPDPYYGPPAGFEHVLDLVEDACDGLIEQLSAALDARR